MSKPSTVAPCCPSERAPLQVIHTLATIDARPETVVDVPAFQDLDLHVTLKAGFQFDQLTLNQDVQIRARIVGPENAPVVLCLGGISANRLVCDQNEKQGWWNELLGKGRAIDTQTCRVLSFDYFPGEEHLLSEACLSDGTPAITSNDQARIAAEICKQLKIKKLHAFLGASYGGMVALCFGKLYPELVEQLIIVCAAHQPHAMGTAWRSIQRKIVRFGLDCGDPDRALALARELGMTTYRTAQEFTERFDNTPNADCRFEVEDYLETRGEAFVGRMTPQRYLCLSESIDRHFVEPQDINVPVTLVGFTQDQIVPAEIARALKSGLPQLRDYYEHPSVFGHDAFLKEYEFLSGIVRRALDTPITGVIG